MCIIIYMNTNPRIFVFLNLAIMIIYIAIGTVIFYSGRSTEKSIIRSAPNSNYMYSGTQEYTSWSSAHESTTAGMNILHYAWLAHIAILIVLAFAAKFKGLSISDHIKSIGGIFTFEIVVFVVLFMFCYDSCL